MALRYVSCDIITSFNSLVLEEEEGYCSFFMINTECGGNRHFCGWEYNLILWLCRCLSFYLFWNPNTIYLAFSHFPLRWQIIEHIRKKTDRREMEHRDRDNDDNRSAQAELETMEGSISPIWLIPFSFTSSSANPSREQQMAQGQQHCKPVCMLHSPVHSGYTQTHINITM